MGGGDGTRISEFQNGDETQDRIRSVRVWVGPVKRWMQLLEVGYSVALSTQCVMIARSKSLKNLKLLSR